MTGSRDGVDDVCVLVCAHNEAGPLPALLDSLRSQTVGSGTFRVLVVDNASTDDTADAAARNASGLDLEVVREPRKGKNWAVNTGYERTRSRYVAHIDADAKADPRWLERIRATIREDAPDLFGGPYYPYFVGPKPRWYRDRYNMTEHGPTRHALLEHEYLSGTNMVWRRAIVERLGGFDPAVGLRGRGMVRGDETEMQIRAKREIPSLRTLYDPEQVVYHLTRPETFSMRYWLRRSFVEGLHSRVLWDDGGPAALPRRGVRVVAEAARAGWEMTGALLARDRTEHPYWQNFALEKVARRVYSLGAAIGGLGAPEDGAESSDAH